MKRKRQQAGPPFQAKCLLWHTDAAQPALAYSANTLDGKPRDFRQITQRQPIASRRKARMRADEGHAVETRSGVLRSLLDVGAPKGLRREPRRGRLPGTPQVRRCAAQPRDRTQPGGEKMTEARLAAPICWEITVPMRVHSRQSDCMARNQTRLCACSTRGGTSAWLAQNQFARSARTIATTKPSRSRGDAPTGATASTRSRRVHSSG